MFASYLARFFANKENNFVQIGVKAKFSKKYFVKKK